MTTPHRPPDDAARQPMGPLARSIVTLAGTPDDASDIDTHLARIAQLAASTLPAVSYASITAVRDSAYTTVAASSELAVAVDQAQYTDDSGPCLDALNDGTPVGVDAIDTTMAWPQFRQAAARMGLHASLSIPLFAGSGATIAVLNLYSRDLTAMIPLNARIWIVFDAGPGAGPEPDVPLVDTAGEDLIIGLVEAFEVRALIQRAIDVVMAAERCTAQQAYLALRVRAAETDAGLADVAARQQVQPPNRSEEPPA